jgi:single-strand DNA-binding protein
MLIEIGYLGRDVEIRHTPAGEAVGTLAFAYNYGRKGQDGQRPTQWIDCTWWGQQPQKLQEHLTKGAAVEMAVDDVHTETFNRRDGTAGHKLVGRVVALKFLPRQREAGASAASTAPAAAPAAAGKPADPYAPKAPPPKPSVPTGATAEVPAGAADVPFDDEIPF